MHHDIGQPEAEEGQHRLHDDAHRQIFVDVVAQFVG